MYNHMTYDNIIIYLYLFLFFSCFKIYPSTRTLNNEIIAVAVYILYKLDDVRSLVRNFLRGRFTRFEYL